MDAIELLLTRQSDSNLSFPGPSAKQLEIIQKAALKVPDHGVLRPFRFIVVAEQGREKLGEIFHRAAVAEQQEQRIIDRAKGLPQRAPMLIIAVSPYQTHLKFPVLSKFKVLGAVFWQCNKRPSRKGYLVFGAPVILLKAQR